MAVNVFDFAGIDLGIPPGLGVSLARRQPAYYAPEVEQSLLGQLMGLGMGGIASAANVLDTVGGPVRNLLAGRFEDVLPAIYDPARRAGGRDIWEAWGVAPENVEGFHPWDNPRDAFWDAAGLATEIATDPLTYMTFGGSALGKAGKVAKRAGLLDDLTRMAGTGAREARLTTTLDDLLRPRVGEATGDMLSRLQRAQDAATGMGVNLDDVAEETLGGLVGTPFGAFGTGATSQKVARGMDTVSSWLRYGNIPGTNYSPGRHLGQLFSAPAGEATSRVGQESIMPEAFAARESGRAQARTDAASLVGGLHEAGFTDDTMDANQTLRRMFEGVDAPATPELQKVYDRGRKLDDDLIQQSAEWGTNKALEDEQIDHWARFMTASAESSPAGSEAKILHGFEQSAMARSEALKNIEGGTSTLIDLARDPVVQQIHQDAALDEAAKIAKLAAHVKANYPQVPLQYAPKALQKKGLPKVFADQPTALAETFLKIPVDKLKTGLFGNHPVADFAVSRMGAVDRLEATKVALKSIADVDLMKKAWDTTATPGQGVRLGSLLKKMGLNRKAAIEKIGELRGTPVVGKQGLKALLGEKVPLDLAKDLTRYYKAFDGPDAAKGLVKALDTFNSYFRAGVTVPFPAFHMRNAVSGAFNNWVKGLFSPTAVNEARTIMEGGSVDLSKIPAISRMLKERGLAATAENSTNLMRELSYGHEATTRTVDQSIAGRTLAYLSGQMPGGYSGQAPFSKAESAKKILGKGAGVNLNPLDIRGTGGRTKSGFGPAQAGEDFAYYSDGINRLSAFITGLKKGMDPRKLTEEINAAQVAYQAKNYTKFENQVMSRVFPFYKYCVPTDHEILTKRGWKRVDDLLVGEPVMAMNPANGVMEWTPLLAVNRFDHDGPMLTMSKTKGSHVQFHCTEGHRWLVRDKHRRKSDGFNRFELAANMAAKSYAAWQVPTNGEFAGSRKSALTPRLAAILGWVLTDGTCRWRPVVNGKVRSRDHGRDGGGSEMIVYQSPSKYLAEIVELLGTEPRKPHPDTGVVPVPVAIEDRRELEKLFQEDADLPGICCKLSREAAEAMWQAMFNAEGSYLGDRQGSFEQHANTHVKDAFQILCILTGRSGNIHKQGVYLKKRQHYDATFTRTWFRGEVWCPTTKHGTWMMRHNGCHVVTGNSRNAMPFMVQELVERPGGKLGQFIRAQDGMRGEEPGTPDYIRETASISLGKNEDGSDRYITGLGLGYEDPLSFAGGGVRGGLLELASRMTPAAKLPIEWATGESMFQKGPLGGREIDDLDPTLGRTAANLLYQLGLRDDPQGQPVQILGDRTLSQGTEFVAANSPLARVFSTARTLTDPRKFDAQKKEVDPFGLLNLLTGARVADISPAAQDKVIQERSDALMQAMGAKTFSETYFPDEAIANMGPADQARAAQFEMLQKMLDQRRRERRQAQLQQAGGI